MCTFDKTKEIVRFYLRTDEYNKPIVTVCLLKNHGTGEYSRGSAICSESERKFIYKEGRKKALGAARRALYSGKNDFPVNSCRALKQLAKLDKKDPWIYYRAVYMPELTDFEKELLNSIK